MPRARLTKAGTWGLLATLATATLGRMHAGRRRMRAMRTRL